MGTGSNLSNLALGLNSEGDGYAYYYRAAALFHMKNLVEAKKSALQASEIDVHHNDVPLYFLLAHIYEAEGDKIGRRSAASAESDTFYRPATRGCRQNISSQAGIATGHEVEASFQVEGETHEHGLRRWSIPRTNMDRLDEWIARKPESAAARRSRLDGDLHLTIRPAALESPAAVA